MWRKNIIMLFMLGLAGCSAYPPMKTVDKVELERFMGDWYVIANIPTFIEEDAHNAVESYQLEKDGTVATTFTFYDGGYDGKKKTYRPTGYIIDKQSNALWGMQFIWPFKADYRIIYLDKDYSQTIIGRIKRDYVWIMARTPTISDNDYEKLLKVIADNGYNPKQVQKVPQKWN